MNRECGSAGAFRTEDEFGRGERGRRDLSGDVRGRRIGGLDGALEVGVEGGGAMRKARAGTLTRLALGPGTLRIAGAAIGRRETDDGERERGDKPGSDRVLAEVRECTSLLRHLITISHSIVG